ncbi:hypothetical protein [Microvirga pakistanensis]|uniref:hypothetical protein n=1 Tax=Microvirga pakistanensis TaxID=1682650 RepID=UPI00141BE011|nr:hypothetical protein [Microvirga pakistanensis]
MATDPFPNVIPEIHLHIGTDVSEDQAALRWLIPHNPFEQDTRRGALPRLVH